GRPGRAYRSLPPIHSFQLEMDTRHVAQALTHDKARTLIGMQHIPLVGDPAHHAYVADASAAHEQRRAAIDRLVDALGVVVAQLHDLLGLLSVGAGVAGRQAHDLPEHFARHALGQRRAISRLADIGLAYVLITPVSHSSVHKKGPPITVSQ